jgi:hypothetical protein
MMLGIWGGKAMKTPILWVVMLGVVCFCAVSATADLLVDSFNYPSNAALQAVWNFGGDAPLPAMATISGVPLSWGNAGATPDWANVSRIVYGYYPSPAIGPVDVYVSSLMAVESSGSLNVDVTLQDYSGDLSLLPIRVDCLDSTGSVAYTSTVTPTTNPMTVAFANVSVGSYTIRASAAKCLSATTPISVTNNTPATASLFLPNGDLDGNGTVTSADLNIGLESIDQRGGQ